MNKKVLVLGGTGFVGSHIVNRLLEHNLTVARIIRTEKDKDSNFIDYIGDITNKESLLKAINDFKPEAVINLVGIIKERPPYVTFDKLVVEGNKNLLEASKSADISKYIYVSAIGANLDAPTKYFITKAKAENQITDSSLNWIIFRPSLIFGKNAGFTNEFANLLKMLPFAPIIGSGLYLFQPVAITTLAECIAQAAANNTITNKIYDVTGPETLTLKEIILRIKEDLKIKRFSFHLPMWFMKTLGKFGDLGLPLPVTYDQMRMLELGSTGDSLDLRKDFKFEEIYFKPQGNYPLH